MTRILILLLFFICPFKSEVEASEACGFTSMSANFITLQLNDSTDVGQNLGSHSTIGLEGVTAVNCDWDDGTDTPPFAFELNKLTNKMEIKLVHSLKDYFATRWKPHFETEIETKCPVGNDSEKIVILALVQDTNNNPPMFILEGDTTTTIEIWKPWPTNISLNKDDRIEIVDYDFEKNNADVSLICQSVTNNACDFVRFVVTKTPDDEETPGHKYTIKMYLESSTFDNNFSFELIATDGVNNGTKQKIEVLVTQDNTEPGESEFPIVPMAAGGGALIILVIVISTALGVFVQKNKKTKKLLSKLTQEEIKEFRQGATSPRRGSIDFNGTIATLPFKKDYEIPRENLQINETVILGSGAFGVVYKGSVMRENVVFEVAVKMLKRNMTVQYFKALLDELKIMAYIGKHPNVVRLIGSCSRNIKKLELFVAVEFCIHGNIRDFLKYRRAAFANMVVNGVLTPPTYIGNLARQNSFGKSLSTMDLIGWATQIANGMDYLSSKQVIHGDLAARNILIDAERVAKISDFGLSRRLVDCTNYSKTSKNTPLPLRWMAPESLKFKKFSTKSDVWSYGILLWEIFALGQTPYPGVPSDEKFVDRLDDGLRMTRPENATEEIYQIMIKCWDGFDYKRPTFLDVKDSLQKMQSQYLQSQGEGYMTLGFGNGLNSYTYRKTGLREQQRRLTTSIFSIPESMIEEIEDESESSGHVHLNKRHTFN